MKAFCRVCQCDFDAPGSCNCFAPTARTQPVAEPPMKDAQEVPPYCSKCDSRHRGICLQAFPGGSHLLCAYCNGRHWSDCCPSRGLKHAEPSTQREAK